MQGDNFVVEAWAYALKGKDPGYHAVLANGDGGRGFLLGQKDGQWALLVGGVGAFPLGEVKAEAWTHLALVKSAGRGLGVGQRAPRRRTPPRHRRGTGELFHRSHRPGPGAFPRLGRGSPLRHL